MPEDLWYFFLFSSVVIVGGLVKIIGGAVVEEGADQLRRWRGRYPGLADRKQSVSVQHCAGRLTSKRRRIRMEAAQMLGTLDRTAVPALLKALELYPDDAPFVECVVKALEALRDSRALPALQRYTVNHNQSLMEAARHAIATIEPQHTLLRATTAPSPSYRSLLRPAGQRGDHSPNELVRATLTVSNPPR